MTCYPVMRSSVCLVSVSCVIVQVAALQQRVLELEAAEQQVRELLLDSEARQQQGDQKHRESAAQLEEALRAALARTKELTEQADLAESRVHDLEEQLGLAGARHKDLEAKLAALSSALRHTVGEKRFSGPPGTHHRSPSPRRHHSQVKGMAVRW